MVRAGLAGIAIALAAAPLGCFVVWRRMAYFGDALAQASILGVALSLTFSLSIFLGILGIALLMAFMISLHRSKGYAIDTLLGVIAHSALAMGLVIASFLSGVSIDLMAYLFGDILTVSRIDLLIIWIGSFIALLTIYLRWTNLLTSTLDEDLAWSAQINPKFEQLILNITLAILIAVSIKVLGILLIVALLIIPPASVRFFSRNPEVMVLLSSFSGLISVLLGLNFSYLLDTPTGPTIVCISTVIFLICNIISLLASKVFFKKLHWSKPKN